MYLTRLAPVVLALLVAACGDDSPPSPEGNVGAPGERAAAATANSPATGTMDAKAPAYVIVRAGSSASLEIALERDGAGSDAATLEVVGLPAGVTVSTQLSAKAAALTFDATSAALRGDHELTLRAVGPGGVRESKTSLIVADGAGVLDSSFGVNGLGATKLSVQGLPRIDALGRTVIAGVRDIGAGKMRGFLLRYTKSGEPDATFGTGGFVDYDLDPNDPASMSLVNGHLVLEDGSIVLTSLAMLQGKLQLCLGKIDDGGHPVPSFGVNGVSCTPQKDALLPLGLQRTSTGSYVVVVVNLTTQGISVIKLTADGKVDGGFGAAGATQLSTQQGLLPAGLQIDSKDRIVVATSSAVDKKVYVWRLTPGGDLDPAFKGGLVKAQVGVVDTTAGAVLVGPKDEVYVGGQASGHLGIIALDAFGEPLTSFNGSGWQTFALTTTEAIGSLVWSDGKLVALGAGKEAGATEGVALAVGLTTEGQLDTTFGSGKGFVLYPSKGMAMGAQLSPGRITTSVISDGAGGTQLLRIWR